MKGKLVLIMLAAFCVGYAQNNLSENSRMALSVQMSPSVRFLTNNSGLNSALKNAGLHVLPNQLFSSELGIGFWVNRLYIVGLGREYSYSKTSGEQIINGKGVGGEVRIHYSILKSERFFFGPYVGLGGDSYDFKFDNSTMRTLGSALASPNANQSVKLSITDMLAISGGVAFMTKSKNVNRYLQIASGFQLGYLWATDGNYRVNDELVKRPSSGFSGIDAKALILFNLNLPKRSS